jgi:hypothetical protein
MAAKSKITAEQNLYTGRWEIGWKWDDGEFTSHFDDYATREEAEAAIPGFWERLDKEAETMRQKIEAEERDQNERWPNLAYVRARIQKLADSGDAAGAFEARQKLGVLLDRDLHELIRWPLPSWTAIRSGGGGRLA